jgi:hypothetical protein
MSFLNPLLLAAMIAAAIPLVIHLLNLRRPQKVAFSTLSFFEDLQKTTIKRIRFKKYLLLLLRVLAVLCLAIVLARPFLPPSLTAGLGDSDEPSAVAFLLDNSVSMERIDEKGPIFTQAQDIIKDLLNKSKEGDRFLLQLTNGPALSLSDGGLRETNRKLEEVEISSGGNYSESRLLSLIEFMESAPATNRKIFILSDGQASQFDTEILPEDIQSSASISFFSIGNPDVQNTAISELKAGSEIISRGLPVELEVSVKNHSERRAVNQFLSLEFEGKLLGQYAIELDAGEENLYTFQLLPERNGYLKGKVLIEGDEFTNDNQRYFSLFVPEQRNIIWIRENADSQLGSTYSDLILQAIKESDSQMEYEITGISGMNNKNLGDYDAIVLDGIRQVPEYLFDDLLREVQLGKGLLFFPSPDGDTRNYNAFLNEFNAGTFKGLKGDFASFRAVDRISTLPEGHPILDEVFEIEGDEEIKFNPPSLYYQYLFEANPESNGFDLLRSDVGDVVLRQHNFGSGKVFIFSIGNEAGWTDLPVNPLFAPLYYRTLLYAAASESGGIRSFKLGSDFRSSIITDERDVELEANGIRSRPEIQSRENALELTYPGLEWEPGYLKLLFGSEEQVIGLNMPQAESEMLHMEQMDSKRKKFEQLTGARIINTGVMNEEELDTELASASFGKEIWPWFMWAGFLLLIAESLVSLYFKA